MPLNDLTGDEDLEDLEDEQEMNSELSYIRLCYQHFTLGHMLYLRARLDLGTLYLSTYLCQDYLRTHLILGDTSLWSYALSLAYILYLGAQTLSKDTLYLQPHSLSWGTCFNFNTFYRGPHSILRCRLSSV